MILILDNYDSFTWNIHHYTAQLTSDSVYVKRNDEIDIESAGKYKAIIFSPGPGIPSEAGNMMDIIYRYCKSIPMLGICLGHQALAEAYGAKIINLNKVLHGIQQTITITDMNDRLFKNIPSQIKTGHYHSWVVSRENLPSDLIVTATDVNGTIMALSHIHDPVSGLQFHPESVMTDHGLEIIANWLRYYNLK
jgi:anthranilate synthase component II